jgi:hypothetical protein
MVLALRFSSVNAKNVFTGLSFNVALSDTVAPYENNYIVIISSY